MTEKSLLNPPPPYTTFEEVENQRPKESCLMKCANIFDLILLCSCTFWLVLLIIFGIYELCTPSSLYISSRESLDARQYTTCGPTNCSAAQH